MNIKFNLNLFRTPKTGEVSKYKNIPIGYLNLVRTILNIRGYRGKYRIRYRGPRYDWSRSFCRKEHALRFAVYVR